MIQFKFDNIDRVRQRLHFLSGQQGKTMNRRIAAAGAKVVRQAVRVAAPVASAPHYRGKGNKVQPGTLRKAAIYVWAKEMSEDLRQAYVVTFLTGKKYQRLGKKGTINKDAYYAPWVEHGHKIVPRRGKSGASLGQRRRAIKAAGGRVVPPHPFFDPATRAILPAAQTAMRLRAVQLLDEAAR